MTQIETLLPWSSEREVTTKRGPRLLSKAKPDENFWQLWATSKPELQAAGVSIAKNEESGSWSVLWWKELPSEVIAHRAQSLEQSRAANADIVIPAPEGCAYLPFQKAGVRFALEREATLIGDEMGLGKTIQAIGLCNALPEISNVLVVTKASLKWNWYRELRKWLVRPLTVGIVDGSCWPSTDVVVINFDLLHKFPKRLSFYWDLVVVDEIQNCRNRKTRRTKALIGYRPSKKEIAAGAVPTSGIPARRRLALTGTPIENRPEELWTILNFLDPKRWTSFYGYAAKYCGGQRGAWGYRTDGASNLDSLQTILRETVMIRRLKKDVLTELPPKTRMLVELEGDGAAEALKAERETWDRHEEDLARMQAAMELAKASDDPEAFKRAVEQFRSEATVAFTEISRVRHETALAKLPKAIECIKEDLDDAQPGSKALIFAHHLDALSVLKQAFGDSAVLVTGKTDLGERDEACTRFQTDPSCRQFIGSIRATGEGLNLQAASTVYFVEVDWNPAKLMQAEDRCHRIGKRDNVLVKYLVLPGSLDARMLGTIIDKMAIADAALDSDKVAVMAEPVIFPKAPNNGTRKQITEEALLITDAQRKAVLRGLQMLTGVCDGALKLDGMGFNRIDARIGHDLAQQEWLSPRQGILGRKIVSRYKAQVGQEIIDAMYL